MKLQRSTGILLGVAIALVATVAIVETNKPNQTNREATLYSFTEGDVDELTINHEDITLSFTKTDDTWQMVSPEDVLADPAAIAFLLNIIVTDPIKETITSSPAQLSDYGLESPTTTVDMTVDSKSHTLLIGNEDFSGASLYTTTAANMADIESINIHVVSKELSTGIDRPVEEWILSDEEDSSEPDNEDESSSQESSEETPNDSRSLEESTEAD